MIDYRRTLDPPFKSPGLLRLDWDDVLDRVETMAGLAIVGLGAWQAWAQYKKAKCEACAAALAMCSAAAAAEE